MSSLEEKAPALFDANMMNQMIFSIGRLRFSLRALENVDCENALLPSEDTESPVHPESEPSMESNKVLESAISELLLSSKNDDSKKRNSYPVDSPKTDSSVEKLQIIHDKLKGELQKIKSHHHSILSKKLDKYKSSMASPS